MVLDANSFQDFLDKIGVTETVRDLREGIESFEKGEGRLANEALSELEIVEQNINK